MSDLPSICEIPFSSDPALDAAAFVAIVSDMPKAEETPKIRFVSYDRDPGTDARIVCDIREFDAPARIDGRRSFTALSKDERRRELLVGFAVEVERLLAGEVDEINVFATR